MEQLKNDYISDNFCDIKDLHPDYVMSKTDAKIYECQKRQAETALETRYYIAQKIVEEIPKEWKGNMLLHITKQCDIIIQSRHSGKRLSHSVLSTRLNLDGTWTKIHGTRGILYNQIIFYHLLVHAPVYERTAKSIFGGAVLTYGKSKERYAEIASSIKKYNEDIYEVKLDNIKQLSSDFEWSLFTEFKNNCFTSADVILCFFHMMQNFMKKINVKFVYLNISMWNINYVCVT